MEPGPVLHPYVRVRKQKSAGVGRPYALGLRGRCADISAMSCTLAKRGVYLLPRRVHHGEISRRWCSSSPSQ